MMKIGKMEMETDKQTITTIVVILIGLTIVFCFFPIKIILSALFLGVLSGLIGNGFSWKDVRKIVSDHQMKIKDESKVGAYALLILSFVSQLVLRDIYNLRFVPSIMMFLFVFLVGSIVNAIVLIVFHPATHDLSSNKKNDL